MQQAEKPLIGVWQQGNGYQFINGQNCEITLEGRPMYCDRGRYIAKLFVLKSNNSRLKLEIDYVDGWNPGRYYFDELRAKAEIEAWLVCRGEM